MKRFIYVFIPVFLLVFVWTGAVQADPGKGKGSKASSSKAPTEVQKNIPPGQLDKANQADKFKDNKSKENQGNKNKDKNKPNEKSNKDPNANKDKNKKNKVKKEVKEKYKALIKSKHEGNTPASFRDANQHWARNSINNLAYAGIISGYPDGTFKPDQAVSCAEALSMIMNTVDLPAVDETIEDNLADEEENNDGKLNLEDEVIDEEQDQTDQELEKVPGWVRNQVRTAAGQKIINLNRFNSAVQASRAQSAVILAKALHLEPVETDSIPFNDGVLISHEDLGYIIALHQEGILSGTPDGRFNPNKAITRAELATLIEKVLAEEAEEEDLDETEPTDEENPQDSEDPAPEEPIEEDNEDPVENDTNA